MHWAVQGCLKWQAEGLNDPDIVLDAVKEYKQEMDLIAGFLDQCIEIDYESDNKIMASELFRIYSRWAKANNEYEMSSKKFFSEAVKKLPNKGRNGKGIFYSNIKLTEYAKELAQNVKQYSFDDFT